jgi:type IV secretion system protein VirB10
MRFFIPTVAAAVLSAGVAQADVRRLPSGAVIPVRFETALSSAHSEPEDRVRGIVRANLIGNGGVVIPAGSEIRGHVLSAKRPGRVKGRGQLALRFDEVNINGRWHRISTQRISVVAEDSHKRDAAMIGGGAGAGAIIGAIKDGKEGAAKGALIGAGTGTGAVLVTRGKEAEIGSGARWRVRLAQPLVVG